MRLLCVCVLLLLANGCLAAEDCKVDDDNCECTVASDGLKLNIRGYLPFPVEVKEEDKGYTYTYSPCQKLECEPGQGARSRVCQRGSGDVVNNCGSNIQSWVINTRDPMEFVITYDGGSGDRKSDVTFKYANTKDTIEVTRTGGGTYDFQVTGSSVGPYTPSSSKGGGGGDISGPIGLALIFLSIVAVMTYFVVGALINYFHLGARGVEIIPQYAFWKDVPFLIKDGFLFTISPCYKPALEKISYQSL